MAEGRVADVVGEASGLYDHSQIGRRAPFGQLVAQHFADPHAERATDAADFQRMGQACVDVIVAGNRVHLSLAAQAAKRAGEDDAVMILVKRTTPQLLTAVGGFAKSFTGKQGMPVQGLSPYGLKRGRIS